MLKFIDMGRSEVRRDWSGRRPSGDDGEGERLADPTPGA